MPHRLAIITDRGSPPEPAIESLLASQAGFSYDYLRWDSSAAGRIRDGGAHLVIALPAAEPSQALALFRGLRDSTLAVPTLALLAVQTDPEVIEFVAETADDFIFWPPRPDELQRRVTRLLGERPRDLDLVREQLALEIGLAQLVGRDPVFLETVRQIPLVARSDVPVLLLGETGTGKESCARAIHHLSPRQSHPFIPVDCGALPDNLAENELFGHVRGAFTGAHAEQKGLALMAQGGTLFLDEVDSLSLPVQAKLLRFLEDHTYRALGADRFMRADVRVLAATNHDLEACVREKRFRQDLFFRLNVLQLRLPALRERRQDIALLARHFLESLQRPDRTEAKFFSPSAVRSLERYHWPGNVRELFNVVQRVVVLASAPQVLPQHLALPVPAEPLPPVPLASPEPPGVVSFREGKIKAIAAYERLYVEQMLRKHDGNITRAAREARQDRRAFGRLVKKHAVDRTTL